MTSCKFGPTGAGAKLLKHSEGSDQSAVVFDAVSAAKARGADVLIAIRQGRLHNKKNLMDELGKISRVVGAGAPDSSKHVFLVLDATTGQNAISQAKLFGEAASIDGIVLTKLDGTAKGGVVVVFAVSRVFRCGLSASGKESTICSRSTLRILQRRCLNNTRAGGLRWDFGIWLGLRGV